MYFCPSHCQPPAFSSSLCYCPGYSLCMECMRQLTFFVYIPFCPKKSKVWERKGRKTHGFSSRESSVVRCQWAQRWATLLSRYLPPPTDSWEQAYKDSLFLERIDLILLNDCIEFHSIFCQSPINANLNSFKIFAVINNFVIILNTDLCK